MNKPPIMHWLCLAAFGALFFGCKKESAGPPLDWNQDGRAGVIELISGNNQSGVFGEYLKDSIVFKIYGKGNAPHYQYLVRFRKRQGNGATNLIDQHYYYTDDLVPVDLDSYIRVQWELGCDNAVQEMDILLYVDSMYRADPAYYDQRPADDSVTVSASGVKPQGWGHACGCQLNDYLNAHIISRDGVLYLIDQTISRSVDGGINWQPLSNLPVGVDVRAAQFNSKGWLYMVTREHGVYYSEDLVTWVPINDGLLDHRDPTMFNVFDDELFVSFYVDGPYRSTDNGKFWRKLVVNNGRSQRYRLLNRHPNGKLYLFDDWSDLYVSGDQGDTWQLVPIDYKYKQYQVEDFKIGPDGMLYIGAGDATISVISPETYEGMAHSIYKWNASHQYVKGIQFVGNDVLYLVMWHDEHGIYSKNANWGMLDLGFDKPIEGYYRKPDGSFILQSANRLYVKY